MFGVADDSIKAIHLLQSKPFVQHLYVLPFPFLYGFMALLTTYYTITFEVRIILFGLLASFQALVWLACHWNTAAEALIAYRQANSLTDCEFVWVEAKENCGVSAICPLEKTIDGVYFSFHRKKFFYEESRKCFRTLSNLLDYQVTIAEILAKNGLSESEYQNNLQYYGPNIFSIPVPKFSELFKEHAVAPFFVFQIFCVALWCLDEYWYYSLFTLFMLFFLESVIVLQRLKTLKEFRGMSLKPCKLYVYRDNFWSTTTSDLLVPGDIISIIRQSDESMISCDCILLDGSCVINEAMLSGESTPVVKESILLLPGQKIFDQQSADSSSMLHGGTLLMQVTNPQSNEKKYLPPDDGACALVIRTGFNTTQGNLVRTMMFSSERVTASNAEALYFILFLLIFAIAAAWYVWSHGIRTNRNRYKLLLDCILIVTSVVPPELPMELSLAVNSSLSALAKFYIYCVEPFRVPIAGKIEVCCFDKTGTLTGEQLILEGYIDFQSSDESLKSVDQIHGNSKLVLANAQHLVKINDQTRDIVGDPMEKAIMTSLGWDISNTGYLRAPQTSEFHNHEIKILRHFRFTSSLKRQSTISSVKDRQGNNNLFVAVKGAPEVIASKLKLKPKNYDEIYQKYGKQGSRVIAFAFKKLPMNFFSIKEINEMERDQIEHDLQFSGFAIFNSPLKMDTRKVIEELISSKHHCIMITGDNPLTACYVASQVGICSRSIAMLDALDKDICIKIISEDRQIKLSADKFEIKKLEKYDICCTEAAFLRINNAKMKKILVLETKVWARISPQQKENIIKTFRELGLMTLMCGDGTNDVGALKQAQIGIALLNSSEEDIKKTSEISSLRSIRAVYEKQRQLCKAYNLKVPPVPKAIAPYYPPGPTNPFLNQAMEERKSKGKPLLDIIQEDDQKISGGVLETLMSEDIDEAPKLKLGDASIAAPFTSKLTSIDAVSKIIRQGRCTLVATIQMYKILALNCLISAYALSVLYLDGIKFGDSQMTISGMLMSVCFMCISRAKPLDKLSSEKPQSKVFTIYTIGSILCQFAIHVASLIYIANYVYKFESREIFEGEITEKKFEPSLLNSAMYLLQLTQQISTFAVNFIGRPFRESLSENKLMFWGLTGISMLAFSCSQELYPSINQQLKLVKFSPEFQNRLSLLMILDFVGCWFVENLLKYLFIDNKSTDLKKLKNNIMNQIDGE